MNVIAGSPSARAPGRVAIPGPRGTTEADLVFVVNPDRLLTEAEFAAAPAPAVAIEAVNGPPGWSVGRANFDHHAGVQRPFCDCACTQVMMAIDEGLWEHLRDGAAPDPVHVYLSRVDEDVFLAVALLEQPALASNPAVRRLVRIEDALDRSGGVRCADASIEELAQIAWIYELFHRRRATVGRLDAGESIEVLQDVVDRIGSFAAGRPGWVEPEGHVEVIARDGPLAVVVEHGPYARLALRREGIDAYVAVRARHDRTIMTVGLTGAFVPLDLLAVYADLNEVEKCSNGAGWGGGTHIGGSPFTGTSLEPVAVLEAMVRHHRPVLNGQLTG